MWSDKNHLFLNTNSINPIASILSLCTTCLPLKWEKKYSCSYLGPASSLLLCLQLIPNLYSSTFILQVFPYSPAFALWTYTSPESFLLEYKHISVSTTILKHTHTHSTLHSFPVTTQFLCSHSQQSSWRKTCLEFCLHCLTSHSLTHSNSSFIPDFTLKHFSRISPISSFLPEPIINREFSARNLHYLLATLTQLTTSSTWNIIFSRLRWPHTYLIFLLPTCSFSICFAASLSSTRHLKVPKIMSWVLFSITEHIYTNWL